MAIKIFITGTDTDIGKTVISALLADYLKEQGVHCGYLKLVSCGGAVCDDCHYVQTQTGVLVKNVYHFPMPASPHLAAAQAGQEIDVGKLDQAMADMDSLHDVLLVEGAGGVLVPLSRSLLLVDYIAQHGVLPLVVARSGLGTLNHTLLTLAALEQRAISSPGFIFNDEQDYSDDEPLVMDNLLTISDFSTSPFLGRMNRFGSWDAGRQAFASIGQKIMVHFNLP